MLLLALLLVINADVASALGGVESDDATSGARPFAVNAGDAVGDEYGALAAATPQCDSKNRIERRRLVGDYGWGYHEIYNAASDPVSAFEIDLDGDGDIDVLSASYIDDTIAWSENLDGSGGSWSYHEIYTAADGATSVFGIDLDGDGAVDVLSAAQSDDTIAWCVYVL